MIGVDAEIPTTGHDLVLDDLQSYYEEEARQGVRTLLRGQRSLIRERFVETLRTEGRSSVLDFGAGPGLDAQGFMEHGIDYVGIDLAHGNARRAADAGVLVLHGAIHQLPVRPRSFDAGWSMSTLMHVPEVQVPLALEEMAAALRSGSPVQIGLWGAQSGHSPIEHVDDTQLPGERRLFCLRTLATNRSLVSSVGAIESEDVWNVGEDGWEYQTFELRLT